MVQLSCANVPLGLKGPRAGTTRVNFWPWSRSMTLVSRPRHISRPVVPRAMILGFPNSFDVELSTLYLAILSTFHPLAALRTSLSRLSRAPALYSVTFALSTLRSSLCTLPRFCPSSVYSFDSPVFKPCSPLFGLNPVFFARCHSHPGVLGVSKAGWIEIPSPWNRPSDFIRNSSSFDTIGNDFSRNTSHSTRATSNEGVRNFACSEISRWPWVSFNGCIFF